MSFFISDSLKDILSEEDLEAKSPITIIEEREELLVQFQHSMFGTSKFELIDLSFYESKDELVVITTKEDLLSIFSNVNEKIEYSILLNNKQYMHACGIFTLSKLEVNKTDNYVVCKIDIIKGETNA